jgi:hypothetical protein
VLRTILVKKADRLIRERKDLSVEDFDGLFLAMIFHFLAANTRMKTISLLSFILMFVNAFLEHHLLFVATGYRENPKGRSMTLAIFKKDWHFQSTLAS